MIVFDDGPTGTIDRIAGALLAFIFCFITILVFPIFLVLNFALKLHLTHPYILLKLSATSLSLLFFSWAGIVSVIAFGYGALNGTASTIAMLSHLWGTSSNPALTKKIWIVVTLGGFVSAAIFSKLAV